MNAGELARQPAFASYLRWIRGTSRIRMDHDLGGAPSLGSGPESRLSLMLAAMPRPNIAVFVLERPGIDSMIR